MKKVFLSVLCLCLLLSACGNSSSLEPAPPEDTGSQDTSEPSTDASALPENLDQYGVIFLGYPNWWADLPMPLYTFLESVDLSGKTIIPFCAHGGSAFSRTVRTITELQPGASVSENGLAISRGSVAHGAEDIADWVRSLGY